jgi:hypothetical protein
MTLHESDLTELESEAIEIFENYENDSDCHKEELQEEQIEANFDLCSTKCIDFLGRQISKTSFDQFTINRRIQNQSRASSGRYVDNLSSVIVASNFLNTNPEIRSNIIYQANNTWGNPLYLRNQSDQVLPSNYKILPSNRFINIPSRGNSVKSTLTSNVPGGSTPGGVGVDVKHGSYQRYLDKKKGTIVSNGRPPNPEPLLWYRENPTSLSCDVNKPQTCGYRKKPNSSGINNKPFKFSLVSINKKLCDTC